MFFWDTVKADTSLKAVTGFKVKLHFMQEIIKLIQITLNARQEANMKII